jgi:carboxypeptidase family protein/type IX secretion system substrate protein
MQNEVVYSFDCTQLKFVFKMIKKEILFIIRLLSWSLVMKKTFVILFAILLVALVAGGVVANQLDQATMEAKKHAGEPQARPSLQLLPRTASTLWLDETVIYETTFENADDWTIVDEGTTTDTWQLLSESGQFGDIPMDATPPFMWVDSDDAGSGADIHLIETLISPVFDAGTFTHVYMVVDIHYMNIGSDFLSMSITVDGGTTWTEFDNIADDLYAYPAVYDISEYATNESECQISILYDDAASWAWYCGIDNFKIVGNDGPFDMLPPTAEITQGPITGFVNMPEGREILAVATDDVGIDHITLEYGLVENMTVEEVLTIDMVATENPDEYTGTIPTELGALSDSIAYAVVAYDAAGNTARSPFGDGNFNYFKLFDASSSVLFIERDYEFIDISSTGTIIAERDDITDTLLFADIDGIDTFMWYSQEYDRMSICSNGWIAFGSYTMSSITLNIPSTSEWEPNNLFAIFNGDLNPTGGGEHIYWEFVDGKLIIQYGSPTTPIHFFAQQFGPTFQAILDPSNNTIIANYMAVTGFETAPGTPYARQHNIATEGPDGLIASILYSGQEWGLPADETSYLVASYLGHIEGTVTDSDAAPLANCEVKLLNAEGETVRLVHSDDTGAYLLDYVVPGDHSVRVLKPGYLAVTIDNIPVEGLETTTQDFTLEVDPNVATFGGTIIDLDGPTADSPAVGIDLYLVQMDMTSTTDENGAYSFGDVPLYDYNVEVNVGITNPAYHDLTFEITTVLNNEPVNIEINQILAPTNLHAEAAYGVAVLSFDPPANHMPPAMLMARINELQELVDGFNSGLKELPEIDEIVAQLEEYQNAMNGLQLDELTFDDTGDFRGYRVRQDDVVLDELFEDVTIVIMGLTDGETYIFEVAADYGYGDEFLIFSESADAMPMAANYIISPNIFEWVEIRTNGLGTTTPYGGDDDFSGPIEINNGETFNFYGIDYTHMNLTNNGYVSFIEEGPLGTYSIYNDVPIPNSNDPNGIVASYWDDYGHYADNPALTTYHLWDEDNNRFIVTWYFRRIGTENIQEHQAIFYPTSGNIVFNYNSSSLGWLNATIGVENQTGLYGTQYADSVATDGLSLIVTPPILIFGTVSGSVTDFDGNGVGDCAIGVMDGPLIGTTEADGSYSDLICPIGDNTLRFVHQEYYPTMIENVVIVEDQHTTAETAVLLAPDPQLDVTTISISYDHEAGPATGQVVLTNNGSSHLDFTAELRLLPSFASESFSGSLDELLTDKNIEKGQDASRHNGTTPGPVVESLTLDELGDVLATIAAGSVTDDDELIGCIIDEDVIYINSAGSENMFMLDFNFQLIGSQDIGAANFWNEMAYDPNTGLGYTIGNSRDLFSFDPADINGTAEEVVEIGENAWGVAFDYDENIVYWSDPLISNTSGAVDLTTGDAITFNNPPGGTPYALMYMPDEENGHTIWAGCRTNWGMNSDLYFYDPSTGEWAPQTLRLRDHDGGQGISGLSATNDWTTGYLDIIALFEDASDEVVIYEGLQIGGPTGGWMFVAPEDGTIESGASETITVTIDASAAEILPTEGLHYAQMTIEGPYYEPLIVNLEIMVTNDVDDNDGQLPVEYALHQNYPNPFNPATSIKFDLRAPQTVSLIVYNMLGQEVAQLIDSKMTAGYHAVNFDAKSLASGVYFYRIKTEAFTSMKKMVLIK